MITLNLQTQSNWSSLGTWTISSWTWFSIICCLQLCSFGQWLLGQKFHREGLIWCPSWNLLLFCFVVWCLEVQKEIDSWEGSKPGWDFLTEIPGKLVRTPGWMGGIERETQPRERGRTTSCLGASVLERLPVEVMNDARAKGYKKNPLPSAYFCFPLWVYRVTFKIALSFPLSCPQLKVGLSEH